MAEEKTMIKFDNVSKEYILFKNDRERFKSLFIKPKNAKRHKALKNVSIEIFEGESVGIIGDNGAGKSTLLKMITGVAFPDSGEVAVNGSVAALLELTAGFALEMTGRENIYLRGYTLGLKDSYIKEIEPKIVEFSELGDYIDQPVRTYSSGMKMRLGFAINVNIDPDILVIDEALSVGDATFRKKCKNRVGEIIKQVKTVLFVSHSKDSVKEMCQKAIYLKKGEVKFAGDVNEAFKVYEADKAEKKKK